MFLYTLEIYSGTSVTMISLLGPSSLVVRETLVVVTGDTGTLQWEDDISEVT